MDKNVLKKFAVESRQELMEKVANKINRYFVDEYFDVNQNGEVYVLINNKHTLRLTKNEYENRQLLVKRIKEITLEQVIEEAAYTWFNRIIAIRYMEIHDFLPLTKENQSLGVRVLSSKDNTPDPEILKFINLINPDLDIDFKKEKYVELKDDNEKFKYVLLLVCKKLGRVIPQVFDGITDYIDILIPDNLLNDTGFITKLIKEVPEENYNQVEIIGWLYQYWNIEEFNRIYDGDMSNRRIEPKDIPAATQLFTPDWVVKYMVENSLGRYWLEHGGDESLIKNWTYFIKDNSLKRKEKISPNEIKCIDPCSGSGHILVYMFEVLYQIYLSYGYSKKDIAEEILKNNIYGLDIDDRASQLSILSVLLKAREYDKNIFNKDISKNLYVMSIEKSINIESLIHAISLSEESIRLCNYLNDKFKFSKEIGSLLITNKIDYTKLNEELDKNNTIFGYELQSKLKPLMKQAYILSNKYDIVVTNPPYMNKSKMSNNLSKYCDEHFKIAKGDMATAFYYDYLQNKVKDDGYLSMITTVSWMYIKTFEELRRHMLKNYEFTSIVDFGTELFEGKIGHLPIVSWVNKKADMKDSNIYAIKLNQFNYAMRDRKKEEFYNKNNVYIIKQDLLETIPGSPIAYWISNKMIDCFKENKSLSEVSKPVQGLATADNARFVRSWFEVEYNKIKFNAKTTEEAKNSKAKWFPYNKGGDIRKWYGNNEYIVNWENDGYEIKNFKDISGKLRSRPQNLQYYFKKSITWSLISNDITFRFKDYGQIFDVAGMSFFPTNENFLYLLGLCNSKVINNTMKIIAPTLNYQIGDVAKVPIKFNETKKSKIESIVKNNIYISKQDWDSFETSWDFKKHPLLEFIDSMPGLHDSNIKVPPIHLKIIKNDYGEECYIADELPMKAKIYDSFRKWEEYTEKQFNILKKNEEELNKIFINIYELQDELTPEVDNKDITIRKADKKREIKSLISYAVGCMFGRYSLDKEGLIYAGGDFDKIYKKYKESDGGWAGASLSNYKVLNDNGKEISLSFEVDKDNIIPINDEAYLGDDIVEKFKKFISVAYGEETLYENLEFIAETLGKRNGETSEDTIRRYFINDFYNDHLKIYQKRPIYWLFDSGKNNGFKCLIYMHRYNEGLVSKIRLDYLHKMQNIYEKELKEISNKLDGDIDITRKRELTKKQADINAKLQETKEYDEKISHIADQKIKIDLDDGVVINYAKFSVKNPKTGKDESILAKIK